MMMPHNHLPNFPDLPGYTIIEQLYVSFNPVVDRAVKTLERVNVIIKLLRQNISIDYLSRSFESIVRSIANIPAQG
jgi:hypothetical protein